MKAAELEILADLDALTDDELRSTIAKSTELLESRDKQRKKEALERARAIMAEAGLPFPGESGKGNIHAKGPQDDGVMD
jgi:lipid-binding SYLF domain-containing protein